MTRRLPRWSNLSLRTKGLIVVSVAVLPAVSFWLVIGLALLQRDPAATVNSLARSRTVQVASVRLQIAVVDAINAARDHAAAADEAAGDRFADAEARVAKQLAELDTLLIDAAAIRTYQQIRQETLAILDVIRTVTAGPPGVESDQVLRAASGRRAQLQAAATALEQRQQELGMARQTTANRQSNRIVLVLLLGSIICVPGGFIAALLLARGLRRRLATLEENAGRLALGEPLAPVPPGADEIARLGTHLEKAGDLLRAREAALRQRTSELEAANRELEAFSYSVSHDLRAPLRAIDGFSQAIEEDHGASLDADASASLRRVRAAARRMGTLIDALLSLSRIGRVDLRRETIDVSAIASSIVAERHRSGGLNGTVTVAPGMMANADPRLVRIAMENLLDNAWKYSSKRPDPKIDVGQIGANGHAVYYVRDNGAGFDMAHAGKLFGAFQRLHAEREFEGTGIGLATVQRIVRRHGGRVWAESAAGAGATFYFTLDHQTTATAISSKGVQ
jgi:signal transduction histidine kinase